MRSYRPLTRAVINPKHNYIHSIKVRIESRKKPGEGRAIFMVESEKTGKRAGEAGADVPTYTGTLYDVCMREKAQANYFLAWGVATWGRRH